jgi:chromosome segregation protein
MKLRKLILSGFKSFADRTELEFDDGISCIVGPNGCGKSNVVDAVKWVLGEQSAKSLRGGEMRDVIFNGSATRRPAGGAEVTLVFQSAGLVLPTELGGQESHDGAVSVTRRLFRSGLSEYLVNNTLCRLRDIREMFMDTGVGADAYSLIEQGQVEAFLQASQEDRRTVFDEAAGISKYKARKKEALRRLERVEQNLLRLNDIVAEVEKRLRSIKHQAGKARSYQAYSQRLKELRVLLFLVQYHALVIERAELQRKLDAASDSLAATTARIEQLEAARSGAEVELTDVERAGREIQSRIAAAGSQIAAAQQRVEMLTARAKELGDLIVAGAARCEELEAKIARSQEESARQQEELKRIEQRLAELADRCRSTEAEHAAGEQAVLGLEAQLEDEKAGTIDLLRRTALLHNEIQASQMRQGSLHGQQVRLAGRAEEIVRATSEALVEKAQLKAKRDEVQEVLSAAQAKLEQTQDDKAKLADQEQALLNELASLRERRSSVAGRIETLREMLDRLEGVSAGVRRVLEARRDGRLACILGMLGDHLSADVEHASIIEAALAGADQQLLVATTDQLQAAAGELKAALGDAGAAEVLCLDQLGALKQDPDIAACPQTMGRVIDHVRFEPWLSQAVWRLLGKTRMVKDLSDAIAAAKAAPAGYRFVTLDGVVLECDGRVRFGSASRSAGVISRRSELDHLEQEGRRLGAEIDQLQARCRSFHQRVDHLEQLTHSFRTAIYEANTERIELDSRLGQLAEQIERLQREQPLVAGDLKALAEEIDSAVRDERQAKEKAAELEQLNARRNAEIERLSAELSAAKAATVRLSAGITELKVAVAQGQAQAEATRQAMAAHLRQRQQMDHDLAAETAEIESNRRRRDEAQGATSAAAAEAERLRGEVDRLNIELQETEQTRLGLQAKLEDIRRLLGEHRKTHEQAVAAVNSCRLELSETDVRIEGVIARASDEMNMDLPQLYPSYQHDEHRNWEDVNTEIAELRDKIERLGNVNLDAIAEQEELEKRREFLTRQIEDVTGSRNQLGELIRRINRESRQRFEATLEAVRANFQELFRKLFGGGRADILLLEAEDVLESPIEIVARPPGKELRSLSLLSGGEKAMTALALLFSIFKTKPSPFCLLDEVDAALDEPNTERFVHLVQQFVDTNQFLIITHAKRTMSMAGVLYGLTMAEPGVSKRISVRFEDARYAPAEQLQPAGA